MTRFKVDENLHDDVAAYLVAAGHDADTVWDEGLRGCDDMTLSRHCVAEDRVLVTLDLDFADIRSFPPAAHRGLIVIRASDQSRRNLLAIMANILDVLSRELVVGKLSIATEVGIRMRQ